MIADAGPRPRRSIAALCALLGAAAAAGSHPSPGEPPSRSGPPASERAAGVHRQQALPHRRAPPPAAEPTPDWQRAARGYPWSFPRDHWPHDGFRTEWWYFVGIAESGDGRRFAWQFTLFRSGLAPPAGQHPLSPWAARFALMGHAAIADLESGERTFLQTTHREASGLGAAGSFPDPEIASLPGPPGTASPWTLRFGSGEFRLLATGEASGFALDLTLRPTRPPLLHGESGYSEKSPGGAASNYYSLTRLEASGALRLDGAPAAVRGWAWMDREFGSGWLAPDQTGWDWFALRLEDGRDLMLYLLRSADGTLSHADGTLLEADGRTSRRLSGPMVETLDWWHPPATDGSDGSRPRPYPAAWRVRIPHVSGAPPLDLRVFPLLADQENRRERDRPGPDIPYWEGAVEVRPGSAGSPAGSGFVELTGYRKPMSLRLLAPR